MSDSAETTNKSENASGENTIGGNTGSKKSGQSRGLGRGLGALYGDDEPASANKVGAPTTLAIELVKPNPNQPRRHFDEEAIHSLSLSIQQKGILQPILVRKSPNNPGDYEIVAGERRWRAAQAAKLQEIPVSILEITDNDSLEIALIENIHREALGPLEEAEAYHQLIETYNYTQEHASTVLGKSRSYIANMIRLLNLPDEVKGLLSAGRLTIGHARALINAAEPKAIADKIIEEGLSVRQTERLVKGEDPNAPPAPASEKPASERAGSRLAGKNTGKQAATQQGADADSPEWQSLYNSFAGLKADDPNAKSLAKELAVALGLSVNLWLDEDHNKGQIVIGFDTMGELDDLVARLTGIPE